MVRLFLVGLDAETEGVLTEVAVGCCLLDIGAECKGFAIVDAFQSVLRYAFSEGLLRLHFIFLANVLVPSFDKLIKSL